MEMGNNLKYIVYLTTNKINNKIYIGVHETTTDEFDGYIGCGAYIDRPNTYNKGKTHLHQAILKYGTSAFHRITLKEFDKLEDALDLECWLVNDDFVKRTDTYNMVLGGGYPPILTKKVYQFDLNGNLIKDWKSIVSIIDYYKVNKDRIYMAIKEKRSFDNCYWSFIPEININTYRLSSRGYVFQYTKDGKLLNTYKNASEASLKLDIQRDAIVNAVFNRTTCFGYYFLRADENIELLLNEKNSKKLANVTPVYRYLITGEYDKEFKSIKEAVENTNKTSHGNIIRAIKNNRTCGGYKWSYIKSTTIQPYTKEDLKPVKIAQYDLNKNLIKIWDSVSDCKKEFPSCQKVCRKERKSTKGFIFEYIS